VRKEGELKRRKIEVISLEKGTGDRSPLGRHKWITHTGKGPAWRNGPKEGNNTHNTKSSHIMTKGQRGIGKQFSIISVLGMKLREGPQQKRVRGKEIPAGP